MIFVESGIGTEKQAKESIARSHEQLVAELGKHVVGDSPFLRVSNPAHKKKVIE